MISNHTSTVAAISTPPGKGGIAVIRISGTDTAEILKKVFSPVGKTEPWAMARHAVFGNIRHPVTGDTVDSGIATFFNGPSSFTGEDMAEVSCHGGILVTRRVLETVFAAGAAPAGPGEFTRRAFISGKMSLTEAEAVGLLLDADTDSRMKLAVSGTGGVLSEKLSSIGDKVADVLMSLFALIDYPEEDIDEIEREDVIRTLEAAAADCEALSATYTTGRAVAEGIPTLICGIPNAGKSSVYNALAGCDRAIVTDIPGTTRDVLEDTVDAGGVTLRLWDTAGIHRSEDTVESMGIDRALARMGEAELILAVYDGSRPLTDEDISLMNEIKKRTEGRQVCTVALINKNDMDTGLTDDDIALIEKDHSSAITISAKTGDGIDKLRRRIGELYGLGHITVGEDAIIWDATRKAELDIAASLLRDSARALAEGDPEDAVCSTVELALGAIRRTDGRGVSEEIVDGIFARFCVGK